MLDEHGLLTNVISSQAMTTGKLSGVPGHCGGKLEELGVTSQMANLREVTTGSAKSARMAAARGRRAARSTSQKFGASSQMAEPLQRRIMVFEVNLPRRTRRA